jgi:hypothetical protein
MKLQCNFVARLQRPVWIKQHHVPATGCEIDAAIRINRDGAECLHPGDTVFQYCLVQLNPREQ